MESIGNFAHPRHSPPGRTPRGGDETHSTFVPATMQRLLHSLCAVAAFAATAVAQACFTSAGGTTVVPTLIQFTGADPVADEGRTAPTALGFTFPMAGVATPLTHCVIETNGVMYLAGPSGPTGLPGNYVYGSLASLRGATGSSPRIAPFWRDIQNMPTGWDITTESVPGVSFKTRWLNTTNYGATSPARSFSATLFANGDIEFSYDVFTVTSAFVGVSIGGGVGATTTPVSNLVAAPNSGALGLVYESFTTAASWDLAGKTIRFAPNGSGGYAVTVPCGPIPASHTAYGAGCYTISDSFYSFAGDAVLANAALQGRAVSFQPTPTTYLVTSASAAFVAPSAAAANLFGTATDDGEILVTLPNPLPTPQGPQASIFVHSNGVLSWGTAAQTFPGGNNYTPNPAVFLAAANAGVWFWHDFNETEPGSGRIVYELVGNLLYLTWNGVESYASPEVANPSSVQAQIDLTSGQITLVFQAVDGNASSSFGSATLVGYSPAGASTDGGSQNIATGLPIVVSLANVVPVALSASPAPVSTATSGTIVTYTHAGVPEAVPGSGVYLGLTVLSVGQDLAGTDLGFLGAPGCRLHVASLDATFSYVGIGSTQTTTFAIPAGVPAGVSVYAQGVALIAPYSQPNGQNQLGVTLSNAVKSTIQAQ